MGSQARQYTIRNVPRSVDQALRRKARAQGKSLNAFLVEALTRTAGLAGEPVEHHDLDELIGTWVDDPETNQALLEQRTVDQDDWR